MCLLQIINFLVQFSNLHGLHSIEPHGQSALSVCQCIMPSGLFLSYDEQLNEICSLNCLILLLKKATFPCVSPDTSKANSEPSFLRPIRSNCCIVHVRV